MSKNIIIQEGGQGKQLTVDKLKTDLVGGGTQLWVPEDSVELSTKNITTNGTYRASDDGYYGYSEVTVSGIGTATGTGPDGETHSYSENGSGGITDMILPDSIDVVTPPTKNTYADGEEIDFSGLVVKAYLKAGGVWTDAQHPAGVITLNELIFPETAADKDKTQGSSHATSDIVSGEIPFGSTFSWIVVSHPQGYVENRDTHVMRGNGAFIVYVNRDANKGEMVFASADPDATFTYTVHYIKIRNDGTIEEGDDPPEDRTVYQSYTYDGKTVYMYYLGMVGFNNEIVMPEEAETAPTNEMAWTVIYGNITEGNIQIIPVQWVRPGDYSTLESSFNIIVS